MRSPSRSLLLCVSITAIAGLVIAGCSSGSSGTDSTPTDGASTSDSSTSGAPSGGATTTTSGGSGGGSNANAVFTSIDENQAINVNAPLNPYNSVANMFSGYNEEQLAWGKNSLTDPNAMYPGIAASWQLGADGKTLTVHIQPNADWSDGTPVTSNDVEASVGLGIANGNSPVTVKIIDDKTVELIQPAGSTSNDFIRQALSIDVVPNSFWGAKIPASLWTNAAVASDPKSSASAVSAANAAITALGKQLSSVGPSKDISCGPFVLERVDPSEAVLAKNPHFFGADQITAGQVVLKSYSSNQQIWTYLKSGQLDAAPYTATPSAVMDSILKVSGNATVTGLSQVSAALAFNQSIKPFDDVNVRRGIAYSIDRGLAAKIGEGTSGKTSGPTTGLIGPANEIFLGDSANSLNSYDKNADKAAEAFKAAGMTQQGGKWMLPNGQPFTVNIQVPNGFSDWVAAGKSITTQLTAEGISSQLETSADYPTYLSQLAAGKFAVGFWLVALGPGPFAAYQRVYGPNNGWTVSGANVSHSAPGANGNWMGSPVSQTVNGQTVNPGELAASLSQVTGDQQKQVVQQLATLTNDQLPIIQIWDYINVQFINTTRFTNFPPSNSDLLRNSPGVWMQFGYVKAK